MSTPISILIRRLKRTDIISPNQEYVKLFSDIDKYGDNDSSKAYLLGFFFNNILDSDNLSKADKNFLIQTIKENGLYAYYYMIEPPEKNRLNLFLYVLIAGGPLLILTAFVQLWNGDFSYGLGTRYLVPIIREGGGTLLLGLLFLIGGIIQLDYQTKRKKLFASLGLKDKA